jgi:hypothetical protein
VQIYFIFVWFGMNIIDLAFDMVQRRKAQVRLTQI